jgi:hypothetical protein
MADQIVTQGDRSWRPPSNIREVIATLGALVATFGIIQVAAPIVKNADFIIEEIRNYVVGIGFALFPPIYNGINRGLMGLQGGAKQERPELAPWFVTGVTAAALLYAWNQFVGFVSGFGLGTAFSHVAQAVDLSSANLTQAIVQGATVIAIPLSAAASIYAGMLLNRLTRSGVLLALLLASLVYLLLNVSTTYIFNREIFMAQLKLAEDPVTAAAFGVGVMLIPLIVFLSGGIGIIISRLNRDRTIGRLSNAARRLKPEERDAVTQDVLDRLAADR